MDEASNHATFDQGTVAIHHRWWGIVLKVIGTIAFIAAGAWIWIEVVQPREADLEIALGDLGAWGPAIFIVGFVVGTSLFFPESVLAIAAGAIFGLAWGMVWTAVAGFLTVAAVCIVGRPLLGRKAKTILERHPRLAAIEDATESSGWRLVFLLRMSPLNFTALNWMLAASRLRFRTIMASSIGMIPGNVSTVYVGFAARHTADLASLAEAGDPDGIAPGDSIVSEVALYSGLGASILVSVIVTRIAINALRETRS